MKGETQIPVKKFLRPKTSHFCLPLIRKTGGRDKADIWKGKSGKKSSVFHMKLISKRHHESCSFDVSIVFYATFGWRDIEVWKFSVSRVEEIEKQGGETKISFWHYVTSIGVYSQRNVWMTREWYLIALENCLEALWYKKREFLTDSKFRCLAETRLKVKILKPGNQNFSSRSHPGLWWCTSIVDGNQK